MKHFPIFLAIAGKRIVVSGGGEAAIAKLRLLMKTEGKIIVFAQNASAYIHRLAVEKKLTLINRPMDKGMLPCACEKIDGIIPKKDKLNKREPLNASNKRRALSLTLVKNTMATPKATESKRLIITIGSMR